MDYEHDFKKASVFLRVIISLVTYGVYLPYWFISRSKAINERAGQEMIPLVMPYIVLVIYSIQACFYTSAYFIDYSDQLKSTVDVIDTPLTYGGMAVIVYLSFVTRKIFNDTFETKKTRFVWTLLFGPFYLQYKVNKEYYSD
ncbi:hypothetical protein [Salipaludibacillus daqingensis]|uniref:hypothetical protein n=1 Tax=Salipaludibacillus daqingensis TaxID=3041001 RepID=UPI00247419D6|nr:hypothetical protein [Salipaludibacillus daqingensis]